MAWLPIEFDTPDKAEILRMSDALRKTPEEVLGCVILVWMWVQQNTPDGRIKKGSLSMIDRASRRQGFGKAMSDVSWANMDGEDLVFPNWDRHNSQNAKARKLDTERKRAARKADSDRTRTGQQPDKSRTTVDNRTEEENNSSSKVNSETPPRANPSAAAAAGLRPKGTKSKEPKAANYQPIREALLACGVGDPTLSELASSMSDVGLTPELVHKASGAVKTASKGVGALVQNLRREIEQAQALARFAPVREWYRGLEPNAQRDIAIAYRHEKFGGKLLPGGWNVSVAWFEWLDGYRTRGVA